MLMLVCFVTQLILKQNQLCFIATEAAMDRATLSGLCCTMEYINEFKGLLWFMADALEIYRKG